MMSGARAHGDPPVSLHEFRNDDQWSWAAAVAIAAALRRALGVETRARRLGCGGTPPAPRVAGV
jgi:hypothetical protein